MRAGSLTTTARCEPGDPMRDERPDLPIAGRPGIAGGSALGKWHTARMRRPLAQINLVTGDMSSAVEFYRLLGWDFEVTPDGVHAAAAVSPDLLVELDTRDFASVWNAGAVVEAGGTVLVVSTEDRAGVDGLFRKVIGAGHRGVQVPYDTFWGARFAVVADPDGHQIGLMSPLDDEARYWPPRPGPRDGES